MHGNALKILHYCTYKMEENEKNPAFARLKKFIATKNGSWKHFFASWFSKPAYLIILVSNIAIFYLPGMDLHKHSGSIIWIYMVQSLMIGVMHFFKLMFYRFSAPSRPTDWKSPKAIAIFFLVHFSFFHFVYAFFIPPSKADWGIVWEGAAVFGFALIVNTIQHFGKENSGKYNANDFMFLPYVRIFPIHVAIILGMFFSAFTGDFSAVVVFLLFFKIAIELFLEYMQQLGVSFAEIAEINKENNE